MTGSIESINEILSIYDEDEKRNGGYAMTEWAIYSAPEDYNDLRTDWWTLKGRADDMYYMLKRIERIVKEMKEESK